MSVSGKIEKKIKKVLSNKILQLNDIVADINDILGDLDTDFFRVAIFGSARIQPDSKIYNQTYEIALGLSKLGIDIVTGGGPGLMEAANKAAKETSHDHSKSIGLPIELPFEADSNAHLDIKRHHKQFSSRLDDFMRLSHAVVVMPGGIGTILEVVYTWQLIQVGHIEPRPIILLESEMWGGFIDWMKAQPIARELMSSSDLDCIKIVDKPSEIIDLLKPELENFQKQLESKT